MGKRLNKVKAFGKKHWKGIAISIGCGITAIAIVGKNREKTEPITGHTIRLGEEDALYRYGISTVTDLDDMYEIHPDENGADYFTAKIDDLGNFGKAIQESLLRVTNSSDCAVMVHVLKDQK